MATKIIYVDGMLPDTERWYAVELRRGETLKASASFIPPKRDCQRDGHRAPRRLAQRLADEAHDPPVAHEAGLLGVEARHEEAARLQEQSREDVGEAPLRVQHREPSEAGPRAHRRAHRRRRGDRGQHARGERARVQRARRVPLVAIAGRQQRHAMARQRPGGDLRGRVVGEARELVELGAVVGDEQRQELSVASVVGPPERDLQLGAEGARGDAEGVGGAGHALGAQPRRFHVARELHDRLLAERARRAQRVGRIGPLLVRAVGALHRERVLEAVQRRRRHPQRPSAGFAHERLGGDGKAAVGRQPHARDLLVGVGETEGDRVALHERACGDDRRRHRRQASGHGRRRGAPRGGRPARIVTSRVPSSRGAVEHHAR
jgi:hypothetical protein